MSRFAIVFVTCWILLGLSGFAEQALGNNLLADPDCELPGAESPWSKFPIRGIAKGSVTQSRDGRSGFAQCLELTEAMDGWTQLSCAIPGGIEAGQDYELKVWLRGDRFMHAIGLVVHDNTQWFPTDYVSKGANVDLHWSEHVLRFRAGKSDKNARVGIRLFNEGRLWVDDVTFSLYEPIRKEPLVGNRVPNSSFELGWLGWTGVAYAQSCEKLADVPHGDQCLKFNVFNGGHISSVLMPVNEGGTHQVSLAIRSNAPTQIRLTLESGYAPLAPVGPETVSDGPSTVALTQLLDVTPSWKTYRFDVDLPPVPSSAYFIRLIPKDSTTFFVDQVQLRDDGNASRYSPRSPLEGHVDFSNPDFIFKRGDTVAGSLNIWNEGDELSKQGVLTLIDLWDRVVVQKPLQLDLPHGLSTHALRLDKLPTGVFRAEVRMNDSPDQLTAETVFAVLPATDLQDSSNSAIGTHVDFAPPEKAAIAGARWTKTWWLAWDHLESSQGDWKYGHRDKLDAWHGANLKVLAVLSGPPRRAQALPENAIPWGWYPPKDYQELRTYAYNAVRNYKDQVGAWEITNEPNSGLHKGSESSFGVAYAKQWRALAEGARQADPNAYLVAGSFTLEDYPDDLFREVFAADPELVKYCDAISYHNYSHSPETIERVTGRLKAMLKEYQLDVPIWDTEWSPVKTIMPMYVEQRRNLSDSSATPLCAAAMLIQGHVARLGAGVQRSFVYNGYQATSIDRYEFEMLVEMSGAPRSTLVAQAILAKMLDGSAFVKKVPNDNAWVYQFKRRNGKQLLIAWARDTVPTAVKFSLPSGWTAYDLMGNRAAELGELEIDHVPVYILAP